MEIGGFRPDDEWIDAGSYRLIPVLAADARFADGFEPGHGRGLAGVWQFIFRRAGQIGTCRARVDAASGELLELRDVNEYGSVTGGTYLADRPAPEIVRPMPFANVAPGVFTNSAGIFAGTHGHHDPRRPVRPHHSTPAARSRRAPTARATSPSAPPPAPTAPRRAPAAPATPTPRAPSSTM